MRVLYQKPAVCIFTASPVLTEERRQLVFVLKYGQGGIVAVPAARVHRDGAGLVDHQDLVRLVQDRDRFCAYRRLVADQVIGHQVAIL